MSFAGYTNHPPLRITNRWLNVRVGIWCDEVPFPDPRLGVGRPWGGGHGGSGGGEVAEDRLEDGKGGVEGVNASGGERSGPREAAGIGSSDVLGRDEKIGDGFHSATNSSVSCKTEAEMATRGQPWTSEELQNNPPNIKGGDEDTTVGWLEQMLSPAAAEVRSVIGAIILVIPLAYALENTSKSSSSAVWGSPNTNSLLEDHHSDDTAEEGSANLAHSNESSWRIKDSYLDIISAINTLRSNLDTECASVDHDRDVSVVLILQGHGLPRSSYALRGQTATMPTTTIATAEAADDGEDGMIEAVEEQLLNSRSIMGWDVVYWNSNAELPSGRASTTRDGDEPSPNGTVRNMYGEKTGIDRVREVLEAVDWSTRPSFKPTTTHHHDQDEGRDHLLSQLSFSSRTDDASLDDPIFGDWSDAGHGWSKDKGTGEGEDDDDNNDEAFQVEHLQSLLHQALAIREAGKDLPRAERERLARRMVGSLL